MNFLAETAGYELCEKNGEYIVLPETGLLKINIINTNRGFEISREVEWKSATSRWERKVQLKKCFIADEAMAYFDRYLQDTIS